MDVSPAAGHLTSRLAGGNGRTEQGELSLDVRINVKAAGRKASDTQSVAVSHLADCIMRAR